MTPDAPGGSELGAGRGPARVELLGIARVCAGIAVLEVEPGTVSDALASLAERCPSVVPDMVVNGGLSRHYVASIDGGPFLRDGSAPLESGRVLLILGAQAGG
jgi:hypothetical protein